MEVKLKCNEIDYELAVLLGEGINDFLVLCADGRELGFAGTPLDSPESRGDFQTLVDRLNDSGKDSWWPEYFANFKREFCKHYELDPETTRYTDFHPKFSFVVSRVCAGYSSYLHCAIRLFEKLGDRLETWSMVKWAVGYQTVEMVGAQGKVYREAGDDMPMLIARAAKRVLEDLRPEEGSGDQAGG